MNIAGRKTNWACGIVLAALGLCLGTWMAQSQPVLTSEPGAITAERGASPMLAVTAAGTSPLRYQWFKGGVAVSAATNPLLPFFRIGPAEGGAYRVVVSNAAGSVTSRVAQVSVDSDGVVFLVTTTSDSGIGSLRRAIEQANTQPGLDHIEFAIPGAGPHTLAPQTPLPSITDPVILDGFTQPGARPNTFATGSDATVLVELNGTAAGTGANGLTVRASGCTIRGLAINGFRGSPGGGGGYGIALLGDVVSDVRVEGSWLGVDLSGASAVGNGGGGLLVQAVEATRNTIGGLLPGSRNVIAGNSGPGVRFSPEAAALPTWASGTAVMGNYIGLSADGRSAVGNGGHGIQLIRTRGLEIGWSDGWGANVIAANLCGIFVGESGTNRVRGNLIGSDVTGTNSLGNQACGIAISDSAGNRIGDASVGGGNLISASGAGVGEVPNLVLTGSRTQGNQVAGNRIGTDLRGAQALANSGAGVAIYGGASLNLIGGPESGQGNLISGNVGYGIAITSPANRIEGNWIGTTGDGIQPLSNLGRGIEIQDTDNNSVGGVNPGQGNVIAFNTTGGVRVYRSSEVSPLTTNTPILGNAVFRNGNLGISLNPFSETDPLPNDPLDEDSGANDLQNFPALGAAVVCGTDLILAGDLSARPNTDYRIELFANRELDPSGYGEGERYLGAIQLRTDASGVAGFQHRLFRPPPEFRFFTATATDADGNTSEFSPSLPLSPADGLGPPFLREPASVTVAVGTSVALSAAAAECGLLGYQWQRNGVDLYGENGPVLLLQAVQSGQEGGYRVRAFGATGTTTSRVAQLSLEQPPLVTQAPLSLVVTQGSSASFYVEAVGTALSYQWQKDRVDLPGQTGSALNIPSAGSADGGRYRVRVRGKLAELNSPEAELRVLVPARIASAPVSLVVTQGAMASFQVTVGGTPPFQYAWSLNGRPLPGAEEATLVLPQVRAMDAGRYSVRVNNAAGVEQSVAAELVVLEPPRLVESPASVTVIPTNSITLGVGAVGSEPLAYQWFFEDTLLVGQTERELVQVISDTNQAGRYRVLVSNLVAVAEAVIDVRVIRPPVIRTQPVGASARRGERVSFQVDVEGTPPFRYQWKLNGANIPAGTNASYAIERADLTNGGIYTVAVGNPAGVALSDPAQLILEVPHFPGSDDFASRPLLMESASGSIHGSNTTASAELFEPAHGGKPATRSVWYRWVPAQNGLAVFQTAGSAFDTVLAVYTNRSLAELRPVGVNDDAERLSDAAFVTKSYFASEVRFEARSGIEYQIMVQGFAGASGRYHLTWNLDPRVPPGSLPRIVRQPVSVAVTNGGAATFQVMAEGGPLKYQWFYNGLPVPHATNAQLTLSPVRFSADPALSTVGTYQVRIEGQNGQSLESDTAQLEIGAYPTVVTVDKLDLSGVPELPSPGPARSPGLASLALGSAPSMGSIILDPGQRFRQSFDIYNSTLSAQDNSLCGGVAGGSRQLELAVKGKGYFLLKTVGSFIPVVAKVERDGTMLDCTTNGILVIAHTNFVPTQYIQYLVTVAGDGVSRGGVTIECENAVLPLLQPEPASVRRTVEGEHVVLGPVVTNQPNPWPSFQWLHEGRLIPGQVTNFLTLPSYQTDQAGRYELVITDFRGAQTNTVARLTTGYPPTWSMESVDPGVLQGGHLGRIAVRSEREAYLWVNGPQAGQPEARLLALSGGPSGAEILKTFSGQVGDQILVTPEGSLFATTHDLQGAGTVYGFSILNGQGRWTTNRFPGVVRGLSGGRTNLHALVGDATVYRFDGKSWTSRPIYTHSLGSIYALTLVNSSEGYLVGQGRWARWDGRSWLAAAPQSCTGITGLTGVRTSTNVLLFLTGGECTPADPSPLARVVSLDQPRLQGLVTKERVLQFVAGPTNVYTVETLREDSGPSVYRLAYNGEAVNALAALSAVAGLAGGEAEDVWLTMSDGRIARLQGVSPPVAPYLAQPAQTYAVAPGARLSFAVSPLGSHPMQFQWYRDDEPLPASTNTSLLLNEVATADAGVYSLRLVNSVSAGRFEVARLRVGGAPVILRQPQSQQAYYAERVEFRVVAEGLDLRYLWRLNGQPLWGQTGSVLVVPNVDLGSAAGEKFEVEVSNLFGSVRSEAARLFVEPFHLIASPRPSSASAFQFQIVGAVNRRFVLEASQGANLRVWTPTDTNVLARSPWEFIHPFNIQEAGRFYRVRPLAY